MLEANRARGLPPLDAAQRTISDGEPRIVVFVDGLPHRRDYAEQRDGRERTRLKGLGYRLVMLQADEPEVGMEYLAGRLTG